MSDEQHIGNDKSRYLNLAGLKTAPRIKKLFTLHKGRRLEA
ncbi:peptide transporter, partial [Salmonella enterica subsp. enterica serovar Heidelberg]